MPVSAAERLDSRGQPTVWVDVALDNGITANAGVPSASVFGADGTRIVRIPVGAPRANAVCERVIGTIRRECLDRMLILGCRHLEAALAEYIEHYKSHRPHRSLGQRAPSALDPTPALIGDVGVAELRRTDRLGGLIHGYRMVACGGRTGFSAPTGS